MVGGYDELTPPGRFYRGPITGINRGYGSPYTSAWHCASCGSTDVSKPSFRGPMRYFRCNRCGRRTRIYWDPYPGDARYDILRQGHPEMESLTRSELGEALWFVLTDLDARYLSDKASEYYGDYYEGLRDNADRSGDASYEEEINDLEGDVPWVNRSMALEEGYVDGLDIGEEYNLPDFPVTVVRVDDVDTFSANRRTTSAGRAKASKQKTSSKSVKGRRTPAKKAPTKKSAGKAPDKKSASRRR